MINIRDDRFKAIELFVKNEPEIYTKEGRSIIYKQSKCSPKQLIKYLKLYWKRGKVKNSLLPDFKLCGVNLWGINPKLWLTGYLEACIANGRKPPDDLSRWIPWQMSESRLNDMRIHDPPDKQEAGDPATS